MIKTKIFRGTGTQVPVYPTTQETFDEGYVAQTPLIAADAADLVTTDLTSTAGGVGSMVIRPLKTVGASGYTPPATDACGISTDSQDFTEAEGSYVKVLRVNGNFNQTLGQDAFLQIWSYPVSAGGVVTTGTLVEGDASTAAHTLLYTERIFEDLQFNCSMKRVIEGRNVIVCISNKEVTFDITVPAISDTNFEVEIETYE